MDYYKIGQQIRKMRKACGFSQEELAEKVNISTTHMSHIETGSTKLSLPVLVDIAAVLDVRVDDLLHENAIAPTSSAMDELTSIIKGCSPQEVRVIVDIVKATKVSLEKHL